MLNPSFSQIKGVRTQMTKTKGHIKQNSFRHFSTSHPRTSFPVSSTAQQLFKMSGEESVTPPAAAVHIRPAGGTENSWCRAVPGGTGVTVLALLFSKPLDISVLQNAITKLQLAHPILKSKLRLDSATGRFSYVIPTVPELQIEPFDLESTAEILQSVAPLENSASISDFHLILEHELNRNPWRSPDPATDLDLFFASVYSLSDGKYAAALRLHTSVCDRTTAVSLLGELLPMMCAADVGGAAAAAAEEEVKMGIEEYVPKEKGSKPFWARGVDVLGYSLNSFRLSNLDFMDAQSPRSSRVVRLRLDSEQTQQILSGCEERKIKLCGLLAAAGLIAAHSLKGLPPNHYEKYAIVTLIDCRSILDPALSTSDFGFYHSAVLNTHDIKGGEDLWELADRTYGSYANAKKNNKHFTDITDVNFLMCKAIENPGLTPSASLRTALISVFEEPVVHSCDKMSLPFGLEDYMGCASSHGVGPSLAIFDTIKNGRLDCACVFPEPLHSREQMEELIQEMQRILVEGTKA